ncbi:MAG: hypothetical protein DRH15_00995 [Deltaproteobacteria bacterium]|nr:MAG: hypothetical protein DRH15_00995 [Deltaproteobacteria bacterium]
MGYRNMRYWRSGEKMKQCIDLDKKVTITFTMKTYLPDGTVAEQPRRTYTFIYGVESQIPSLEEALKGAIPGDKKTIEVPPAELYGEHDPSLIREIPKAGLIRQRVKQGKYYRQMKRGSLVSFKVLEVKGKSVVADFNPPTAGISATVDLEVIAVTDATQKEISAAMEAQTRRQIGCG